jgi:hypothetical protein
MIKLLLPFVLLASGPAANQSKLENLMDQIESTIRLPNGAELLGRYARYYAFDDKGDVVGVYLILGDDPSVCKDGDGRTGDQCYILDWGGKDVRAGERVWVPTGKLPVVIDGGCTVVSIHFNRAKKSFDEVRCNGIA